MRRFVAMARKRARAAGGRPIGERSGAGRRASGAHLGRARVLVTGERVDLADDALELVIVDGDARCIEALPQLAVDLGVAGAVVPRRRGVDGGLGGLARSFEFFGGVAHG